MNNIKPIMTEPKASEIFSTEIVKWGKSEDGFLRVPIQKLGINFGDKAELFIKEDGNKLLLVFKIIRMEVISNVEEKKTK